MTRSTVCALMVSASLATACAARGEVEYASAGPGTELVEIGHGVSVVANTEEPTFFTNNAYWVHRDRAWYRADHGTWIRIATPPPALVSIADPDSYAHFSRDRATRTTQVVPTAPRAPEDVPYANPRPPQQRPPIVPDDPGSVDRVPADPMMPPESDDMTRVPRTQAPVMSGDEARPDRMRDR